MQGPRSRRSSRRTRRWASASRRRPPSPMTPFTSARPAACTPLRRRSDVARLRFLIAFAVAAVNLASQCAAEPGDLGLGDKMIRAYLARETAKIESRLADDLTSREAWEEKRP